MAVGDRHYGIDLRGLWSGLVLSAQIATGELIVIFAEEFPSYSGDGRYLAFASERDGRRNIFLYDLQTNQLVNLPNLNRRDSSQDQPDLSEDGRFIAYVSTERGRQDVFVYDRNQGRSQLLTVNLRGSVQNPTISGDGRRVAFQSNERGQWNLMLVDVTP